MLPHWYHPGRIWKEFAKGVVSCVLLCAVLDVMYCEALCCVWPRKCMCGNVLDCFAIYSARWCIRAGMVGGAGGPCDAHRQQLGQGCRGVHESVQFHPSAMKMLTGNLYCSKISCCVDCCVTWRARLGVSPLVPFCATVHAFSSRFMPFKA